MDKLILGQINLQGSAVATAELPAIAGGLGLDAVLVQEPYPRSLPLATAQSSGPYLITTGENAKSGVLLLRRDVACTVLQHLSNSHCTVCHLGTGQNGVNIVSAYFQYSEDINQHLDHLGRVLDALRGQTLIVGADANAHSPLWHCWARNYTGRGHQVSQRRQLVEDFIAGRGLVIQNQPGQPATFSTVNGESNIDLTLTSRDARVSAWQVHANLSSSDHRLITFMYGGARGPAPAAEPLGGPRRFREKGVDWNGFEKMIHARVGRINWNKPASKVCRDFTNLIVNAGMACLGVQKSVERTTGYEWWSPALDDMRKRTNKARKIWQDTRKRGPGVAEEIAGMNFRKCRSRYRATMREAQTKFFRELADTGNQDPWGLAYRMASGRLRPPRNVINGTKFSEGYAGDAHAAMGTLARALCPDDDLSSDTEYHRRVRLLAACAPSGRDAPPPSREALRDIVNSLANTAPGIDGVTARMVKHAWRVADSELTRLFGKCVEEGTFPDVWKDGQLIVLPKGNNLPLTDPKAYRPITLLSVLGKVLERVLLHCAPNISRNTSSCQHGFRPGRSTVTAIRSLQDAVASSSFKYVQAVLLDISGAFDNAWWPMILLKAKNAGCCPNIYRMLVAYFTNRRAGVFVGGEVVWKPLTMGCPQGSVLGPSLWNLLMDDLFRLPYPPGVRLIAYADDVTILIESNTRAGIEASASKSLDLISKWGVRNRLGFSPSKSLSMTLKGRMPGRPPTVRLDGGSVRGVRSAKVLGVVVDSSMSFHDHAQSIGERAAAAFGKMSRVSASSWGIRYRALRTLYRGTYTAIVTYAAGCWWKRTTTYMVRSALLRSQRLALILLTKAYRTASTAALPVLAGVLPADLEVARAGRIDDIRHLGRDVPTAERRQITEEIVAEWQQRWDGEAKGRELYRFFPEVGTRLKSTWVEPDYQCSQILTGHGSFRKRLNELKLCEDSTCYCGLEDESMHHVLWNCPLYEEIRTQMMDGIHRLETGPVYYRDLVGSAANFRRLSDFAHKWHEIRSGLEQEERTQAGDEGGNVSSVAKCDTSLDS